MSIHKSQIRHEGEVGMTSMLQLPPFEESPTVPFLTPERAGLLPQCPMMAVGTVDANGDVWTTVWGGERGFTRAIANSIIGVKTFVDAEYDPVVDVLLGGKTDGEIISADEGKGRVVSALAIDLETRRRVKLMGRAAAGAVDKIDSQIGNESIDGDGTIKVSAAAEMQLVVKIESSLGNCPKYLNKKHIYPHPIAPTLISNTLPLPPSALAHLSECDHFYLSSTHPSDSFYMSTNYRGGPEGFVRVLSNSSDPSEATTLAYPEYSGNRLYQTLGNLKLNPRVGVVFPDLKTGNVLYITGTVQILAGKHAAAIIPRTNLVVTIQVTAARYLTSALPFRAKNIDYSPYNPPVRLLASEHKTSLPSASSSSKRPLAALTEKEVLSPSVFRVRFRLNDYTPPKSQSGEAASKPWAAGQYIALSFEDELGMGYSHMRNDDPSSLNDDLVRTWTIASAPPSQKDSPGASSSSSLEFDIIMKNVGRVTNYLSKVNIRSQLEIPVVGIGGEFTMELDQTQASSIGFVAGGVGITPFLAMVRDHTALGLDLAKVKGLWSVKLEDLGLVKACLGGLKDMASIGALKLFVSGSGEVEKDEEILHEIRSSGVEVARRRLERSDVVGSETVSKWYVCAGVSLRKIVESWAEGKEVVFEDFAF